MALVKHHRPGTSARRVMVIYGPRPEAVKVAPLIRALDESTAFTPLVAVTAQHGSMLAQVNEVFGIKPELDLDIHRPGQTLPDITTSVLRGVQAVLHDEQPDAVVVQGDTTTVFAAALAAFYEQIPVVHLEAGVRTGEPHSPPSGENNPPPATQRPPLPPPPPPPRQSNPPAPKRRPAPRVGHGGNPAAHPV